MHPVISAGLAVLLLILYHPGMAAAQEPDAPEAQVVRAAVLPPVVPALLAPASLVTPVSILPSVPAGILCRAGRKPECAWSTTLDSRPGSGSEQAVHWDNNLDPYTSVGSVADERRRTLESLGAPGHTVGLFRSATAHGGAWGGDPAAGLQLLTPRGRTVWNSDLPFTRNEGTLWAGRGINTLVSAGLAYRSGPFWAVFAPELAWQANADFQTIPSTLPERSPWAHPWHTHPESLDAPMRFGDDPFTTFHLGESAMGVDFGALSGGFGTERQWWGAGEQNAVLLGYHAPGFPHLFLRTREPVATRFGEFEGRWLAGWLQESDYFTLDREDGLRGISALAVSWRPPSTDLWLGASRAVYGPDSSMNPIPVRFLDILVDPGRPNDRRADDMGRAPGRDQMLSFFFRYLPGTSGFDVYGEWALRERPRTLRDLLTQPNHGQAYTLGLGWARTVGDASILRVRGEASNLERTATYLERRVVGVYKSRPVPQGFTHQGRVLGAWIGTGGSSQWAALDLLRPGWGVGLEAGRVRWETDSYVHVYPHRHPAGMDMSVYGGVNGHFPLGPARVALGYLYAFRYNYLFQHESIGFQIRYAEDIPNHQLRITIEPRR